MKTNDAESKLVKLGETSARNGGGNPEPSLSNEEGVETRRQVCIKCERPLKGRQRKFCSTKCSGAYNMQQYRIRKGLIKKPFVGSGGNQWNTDNHRYKNGIGNFQQRAFEYYDKKCNRCESTQHLLVHHKDHDRTKNEITNLEILCKKCHQKHHCKRDPKTGRYIKG
jgi:hypothetical protein